MREGGKEGRREGGKKEKRERGNRSAERTKSPKSATT
jgi:hypothetical protein